MTPTEQNAIIRTELPTLLHGDTLAAWEATKTLNGTVDSVESFGGLAISLAVVSAAAARTYLPAGAIYSPPVELVTDPACVTGMQIISAIVNNDRPMAFDLVHAAASDTAEDAARAGRLLGFLGVQARVAHQAVCDGIGVE